MKTFVKTLIAGTAMAVAFAAPAQAEQQKVVSNQFGNVSVNSFGNCVLTKWTAERGGCHNLTKEQRTVYFDFAKSSLNAAGRAKLDNVVKTLRDAVSVESVDIVGFADAIGDAAANDRLSMRRANTVKNYLSRRGLRVADTEVRGLGETSSISDCDGKTGGELRACLWRDRRVELELNIVQ